MGVWAGEVGEPLGREVEVARCTALVQVVEDNSDAGAEACWDKVHEDVRSQVHEVACRSLKAADLAEAEDSDMLARDEDEAPVLDLVSGRDEIDAAAGAAQAS